MKRFILFVTTLLFLAWLSLPSFAVHADSVNLLANPSAENLVGTNPVDWTPNTWGTSDTTISVSSDAHTGARALNVTTGTRTDGDAKWMPTPVNVVSGQTYTYGDYSKASVPTQLIAAYTNATNTTSYYYLKEITASTGWQANTVSFTVPANQQKVAVFHILSTAGTLTTDDFSLVGQQVETPAPSGDNLITNPSMESGMGTSPAGWQSDNWGTNTTSFSYVTNDSHTGGASAKVQMTSYTDGDAKWYFTPVSVQPNTSYAFSDYYKATIPTSLIVRFDNGSGSYSYQTIGTVAAASSWRQASATFTTPAIAKSVTVLHILAGIGSLQTDDASLSAAISAPTVAITAPQGNSAINGSVPITATVTGSVASVQLQVDGVSLGAPLTTSPYQYLWDTTTVTDGPHSITAILTPTSGSPSISTAVQVTVHNASGVITNLFPNPSLETPDPANTKLPLNWQKGSWGTNMAAFSYVSSGHTGTHSVKVQISSYTNGAAYWRATPEQVTGGQLYSFSDYYKSSVPSEVDAEITLADGSVQEYYVGNAFASPNSWTKFETQFTMPAGAVSIVFFHSIFSVGYLTTDDFSLTQFSYQGFNRPIVSITDDDGFADYYTKALPILQKYNLPSTAYVISSYIGTPDYLSLAQLQALQAAGVEIGSHSVDHADLSTLTSTQQKNELKDSQTSLRTWLGAPIANYAAPYGAYNQQIVSNAQAYYQTYRGVQAGYNAKNNFDPLNLRVQNIVSTTTVAQIESWLQQAAATNTWLILVYHEVSTNPDDATYNTPPTDFDAQMAAVKASGIAVETVAGAMNELRPQLP